MKLSAIQNWDWTVLMGKTLKGLLTGDTPMKQLMGPLGIAELSGSAAEAGWLPLFTLMAIISLNLGLFNLLPIPVLDGGHILILGLEGISRRDFSLELKSNMVRVGAVLLLTLMATVLYNDLMRVEWIKSLMAGAIAISQTDRSWCGACPAFLKPLNIQPGGPVCTKIVADPLNLHPEELGKCNKWAMVSGRTWF